MDGASGYSHIIAHRTPREQVSAAWISLFNRGRLGRSRAAAYPTRSPFFPNLRFRPAHSIRLTYAVRCGKLYQQRWQRLRAENIGGR